MLLFLFQLKDLQVFSIIRVIFQLAEEIPCISAVVVALLAEVTLERRGDDLLVFLNLPFTVSFVQTHLSAPANQV